MTRFSLRRGLAAIGLLAAAGTLAALPVSLTASAVAGAAPHAAAAAAAPAIACAGCGEGF